jgi:peroxidase
MAAKLAVLALLALLGSVSCKPCNGNGNGHGHGGPSNPTPPPPAPTSDANAGKHLVVGYYKNKCGSYVDVEAVVKKHVKAAHAGLQAGLVRLFFHDCFVRVRLVQPRSPE